MTEAGAAVLARPAAAPERLHLRVARRIIGAEGIVILDLAAPDGAMLPPFEAGAHIDVHLAGGFIRQYSLVNAPWQRDVYRLGILLEPSTRGGSRAVHDLKEGDTVEVGSPRNLFPLVDAPMSLLLGGGIGITPMMSMAATLHRRGQAFALHYFVRSRNKAAFYEHLTQSDLADAVNLHCDDETDAASRPIDETLRDAGSDVHVYVCGPAGFITAVEAAAAREGLDRDRIHIERFSSLPATGGDTFEVKLARTGRSFVVPPGKTIAETLLDNDVAVELSCEQGICGTCITRVLEGAIDHRDQYLTDDEHAAGEKIAICCSRALSGTLVLDL